VHSVLEPPGSVPTTRRRRVAVAATVVLAAAAIAAVVVAPTSDLGVLAYLAVAVGAGVAAWVGSSRQRSGHLKRPLRWLAAGVVANAVAEVVWQVQVWVTGTEMDIGPADLFYLAAYVGVGAGLLLLSVGGALGARARLHALLDGGAVLAMALLVVWQASVQSTLGDDTLPVATKVVWALYPVLDAVLIGLVARWLLLHRRVGATGLLLVGGAGCWLAADLGWLLLAAPESFSAWLTAGWLLGAVLLAAVTFQSPRDAVDGPAAEAPGLTRLRLSLALLPLLVPAVVAVVADRTGVDVDPAPGFLVTLALVLLFAVRADGLLRETQTATEHVASQARRFEALALSSSDAFAVVDADGRLTSASASLSALVGASGPSRGRRLHELLTCAGVDPAAVEGVLERARLQPGTVFELELSGGRPATEPVWFGGRAVALLDDPDVRGVVISLHDITRRKDAEQELAHQAFHDELTGLANRTLFLDRTEQALRRAGRSGGAPTVLCLDLDGFKTVNDSLGHLAGDELLRVVARRLQGVVRAADTVARLGGDEFVILVDETSGGRAEATALADRVLAALAEPLDLDGTTVAISASIGVVCASPDSAPLSLLRDGDIAMYRAKAAGRGRSIEFVPDMRVAELERIRLESDLAHTVDGSQLRVVYQPVVDLADEHVVGFEALLRWDHPELGTVAPDRFIPIAEATGMIVPIGRWVLDVATRTAARWQAAHPRTPAVSMAVNVSARQLTSPTLVEHVREALARSGMEPRSLVLEVTETALVTDPEAVAATLAQLRALGVRLALDDFGTGYSSLSYLRQFDVDILKIDRSFVAAMTADGDDASMLQGLLELGRRLRLEVVAEGVELEVQRDLLRDERCELAQGYLFARPLDPTDAEQLLVTGTAPRPAIPNPRPELPRHRPLVVAEPGGESDRVRP
jgi:diguanylate cyclase (GGDEF)-like protein/PAS domain S-box-containing protein